ncbi:hypothetical protein BHM03_00024578 [Ensete ventricosum]|nr:hypothetical protein BHM03_00024578 [Ensete ventricosum]
MRSCRSRPKDVELSLEDKADLKRTGLAVAGVSVSGDELDPAGDSNINPSMSTYKKKKASALPGSSGLPLDGDGLAIGATRTADGTSKEE